MLDLYPAMSRRLDLGEWFDFLIPIKKQIRLRLIGDSDDNRRSETEPSIEVIRSISRKAYQTFLGFTLEVKKPHTAILPQNDPLAGKYESEIREFTVQDLRREIREECDSLLPSLPLQRRQRWGASRQQSSHVYHEAIVV